MTPGSMTVRFPVRSAVFIIVTVLLLVAIVQGWQDPYNELWLNVIMTVLLASCVVRVPEQAFILRRWYKSRSTA